MSRTGRRTAKANVDNPQLAIGQEAGLLDSRITRRQALSTAGKAAIGVVAAAVVAGGGYTAYTSLAPSAPTKVRLDFTAWDYSVTSIKDNIEKFQGLNPNIEVTMTNAAYSDYLTFMAQRFTAKTPTDVVYDGEDWLAQWASSGWVVPLQDYWDQYQTKKKWNDYVSDMVPFAKESMTFQGKIYGLPYYSDTFNYMFNKQVFDNNDIEAPNDWDDVRNAALKLKQGGMKFPYLQSFQGLSPFDFYQLFSGAMGRGATLLDSNNNPTFSPSSGDPFFDQLQWVVDGINKDQFINTDYTAIIESDVVKKMGGGDGAMTLLAKYNLAAMNSPGSSPSAGNFVLGLMPGKTHTAYGFAKMYNLTKMAVDRGKDVVQAAITYIEYFGANDGPVLKRWAVENGLGFGFVSAFNDPEIADSIVKLYGPDATDSVKQQFQLAHGVPHPVWFGQWLDYSNKEAILPALRSDINVEDAINRMLKQAQQLNRG